MNLHQLEIFLAVAETGSFSRAAADVLLTQSTVSQHVAALENELGVRLFDRTGRGAELTEGGRLFQQHVRQVLSECADLRLVMARFRGLENPQLTIGASNIPANYLIPGMLPVLAARHPGIILHVISADSRAIVDRLSAGAVALAVVGDRFDANDIDFLPLLVDTLQLVVGSGHPWWNRSSVTLEELSSTPLIAREAGSGSGHAVDQALQQAGFDSGRLRVVAHLGGNEAVKQAVIGGYGAAFLSTLSIRREMAHHELKALPVAGICIARRFWLATRRGRILSPAAQAFAGLIAELYGGDGSVADARPGAPHA